MTSASAFIKACDNWEEETDTPEQFGMLVDQWLGLTKNGQRRLAAQFDLAISTVSRWRQGKSTPYPMVQDLVVQWLKETVQ